MTLWIAFGNNALQMSMVCVCVSCLHCHSVSAYKNRVSMALQMSVVSVMHVCTFSLWLIQHRENLSNITSSTRGKLHNDSMSNDQNLTLHHVCFIPCLELMPDRCKPNLLHMEQFTCLFGNNAHPCAPRIFLSAKSGVVLNYEFNLRNAASRNKFWN